MTDLDKAFEAKMAEKQNTAPDTFPAPAPDTVAVTKVDEETGELVEVGQLVPLQLDESFLDFSEADLQEAKPSFNISTVSLEFNKVGDKGRYKFAGFSQIDYDGTGDFKPVANLVGFQNGVKTMFTNSGVQLKKELTKVPPGTIVEIELVKEQPVKSAPGAKAKIYSVTICQ